MNPQAGGPQLHPNPEVSILHRQGQLFGLQLAAPGSPVALAAPDLVLLSAFSGGASPAAAAERLAQGDLRRLLPAPPPPANVLKRIKQLFDAGILLAGRGPQQPGAVVGIDQCSGAEPAEPELELRLSSNFRLQPGAGGWRIWSAPGQCEYLLAPALALLACAFAGGRDAAEVVRAHATLAPSGRLFEAIGWLRKAGLLARMVRTRSERAVGARALPALPETDTPDWQRLQPDGRIPVYFAPHMENHYPLALGMLYSAIGAWEDGALLERFQLIPIAFLEPQQLFDGPYRKFGPGIWLFSNYMWSLDINLKLSQGFKSHHAGNLCVHGGPSTPGYKEACEQFMVRNRSVDVAVHGEGEVTICELLHCIHSGADGMPGIDGEALRGVHGLTFRRHPGGELAWTPPRVRMREPDQVPSPYLQGVFDHYRGRVEAAIIESNRGCPFGCTFCDWGSATSQKVRKFDLERVKQEVEWIGRRGIRVLWIADANFGMYDRDIELAEHVVATKARFGYPSEVVVNYTKNTNRRLIEIIRIFSAGGIISQGIISIQTTDEATLEVINRRNIKTEKYDELAKVFEAARLPLSTDLMIGLPGITVAAWDRDLQRYFDADVSVKAYPTQLLPNSPMADPEYRRKYRIETDQDDFVVACHSFTRADLAAMKAVYYAFEIAEGYGVLRYVMRYLQWDHGIQALPFLHRLLDCLERQPARYPTMNWVLRYFRTEKNAPGGWHGFFEELQAFITAEYGLQRSTALDTALAVNEAAMPDDTLQYPRSIELAHDFTAWFHDRRRSAGNGRRLSEYPPAGFSVDDPELMAHIDMDYLQYDSHQYFWELHSAVARPKSVSDVKDRIVERRRQSA